MYVTEKIKIQRHPQCHLCSPMMVYILGRHVLAIRDIILNFPGANMR